MCTFLRADLLSQNNKISTFSFRWPMGTQALGMKTVSI